MDLDNVVVSPALTVTAKPTVPALVTAKKAGRELNVVRTSLGRSEQFKERSASKFKRHEKVDDSFVEEDVPGTFAGARQTVHVPFTCYTRGYSRNGF